MHVDDAAAATAAALECAPGAYNIVDGDPTAQGVWLPAFASAVGAPRPPQVSEEEARATSGPDAVYYATLLRGASNEKAKRELEFRPRRLEWLDPCSLTLSLGSDAVAARPALMRRSAGRSKIVCEDGPEEGPANGRDA